MTKPESKRLHDLLANECQREEQRWRCPNCRLEMSAYVNKCSYCSAEIHEEEHLTGNADPGAIERLIHEEHDSTGGKTLCQFCHTLLDSHVYKCPNCGAQAAGLDAESETSRYQALIHLPLVLLLLFVGLLLGVLIWYFF